MLKRIIFALAVIISVVSGALSAYGAAEMIETRLSYDGSLHSYRAEAVYIEINGERLTRYSILPVVMNDRILVSARDVFSVMGCDIGWDNDKREVTVRNSSSVIVIPIDKKYIYKNGTRIETDVASKLINNYTMIPIRAVAEALSCDVGFDSNTRVVSIDYDGGTESTASIAEPVTSPESEVTPKPSAAPHSEVSSESGIKILWDTISTTEGNDSVSKRIPIEGLDVICPTWFAIKDTDGTVGNVSKKSYVEWAHGQGYKVWALVTNSFDPALTHGFLQNAAACDSALKSLLDYCIELGVDGINVDFETIYESDGTYYVDFMKKLADSFHDMGMTVSVDTYVPAPYNARYHMEDMGKICDYVIMMAYDEHFAGDTTAGSVSSIPWVEKYLETAAGIVPGDKLVLGCPFYTRVWEVTPSGAINTNASCSMDRASELLEQNGAKASYDEETGQNYGEYSSNGNTFKIWLEDETSLRARMELSQKYGCAGAAFWRRGFENDAAWEIINEYYR